MGEPPSAEDGVRDASTVLAKKTATYRADREHSGAEELIPGYAPPTSRSSRGRLEVGGRLTLTPTALWFHGHPLNFVRLHFGIPLDQMAAVTDVSAGLAASSRVHAALGDAPDLPRVGHPEVHRAGRSCATDATPSQSVISVTRTSRRRTVTT